MEKIKLAICMKDLEYQNRFVNCFMNHYRQQYELHVFTNLDHLKQSKPLEYAVIITGEYSTEEMASFVERGEILLYLVEEDLGDNQNSTEKYQEVYKIAEKIGILAAGSRKNKSYSSQPGGYQKTGIYSLSQEVYQIPFSALLAKYYSEKQKVLVLDLQSYSGLQDQVGDAVTMGLEDLLSVAVTKNYSKGRVLESIRHEPIFDYVSPVQNSQSLVEGTQELYQTIMDMLAREFGYERFIINFGSAFYGQVELMKACEEFYLLTEKDDSGQWREKCFLQEMKKWGNAYFADAIHKISVPSTTKYEKDWRAVVEKWCWSPFGESMKQALTKEHDNGTVV